MISNWSSQTFVWPRKVENEQVEKRSVLFLQNRQSGDVFTHDSTSKIAAKCAALVFARPLHSLAKTAYHCCLPLSMFFEIRSALHENRSVLQAVGRNLADVVRTPLYGLALTILAVVGLLFGLVCSERIYDIRAIAGRLEAHLNWGALRTSTTLAPCFQPFALSSWNSTRHDDTDYSAVSEEWGIAKANLSRATLLRGAYCYSKDVRRKMREIESRENNLGFVYRMLNPQNVPIYLIGSVHAGTQAMAKNPHILSLIDQSKELITELEDSWISRVSYWFQTINPFSRLKYSMDREWVAYAKKKGIRQVGLESLSDQVKINQRLNQTLNNWSTHVVYTSQARETLKTPRDKLRYELVSAWQNGDEAELNRIAIETMHPAMRQVLLVERNQKWLASGLLEKIQNTQQPLCVVVGAAHLFGPDGLLNSLAYSRSKQVI